MPLSPRPTRALRAPRFPLCVLACGALMLAAQAQAQTQAQPQKTAAQKQEQNEKKTPTLPQVTVTGTSLATDLQTYPGSVTVIEESALQAATSPIEALQSVPGVSTGDDLGRGLGQYFNIRGFGYQSESRVIVMQGGVRRSMSLYSNHISTSRSDNDLLKRIEVVKGASSIQYGGGAIGGVVDMGMKTARDFVSEGKNAGLAAKLRYEHNNYREGYAAAAYAPQDGRVELLAYGKKGKRGDQTMSRDFVSGGKWTKKVPTDEDLTVGYLQGGLRLTPDQKLSLSYYDYGADVVTVWQNLWHSSASTRTGPVIGKLKQQDWVLDYSFKPAANPWIDLKATAFHSRGSYDRHYTITPVAYANFDKRHGLRVSNAAHFETGRVSHRLLLGLDYERRQENARMTSGGKPVEFGSMPNTYTDTGLYGHLESSMLNGGLVLQLGGRYDHFDRKVSNSNKTAKESHFSPRVGASVRLFDGFHLLGNWAEAFRAPTPHETHSAGPINPHYFMIPNYGLKPETARETELGFSWSRSGLWAAGDELQTKFMAFSGRIRDMINLTRIRIGETPPESESYASYLNVGKVKRHGFEWTGRYSAAWGDIGAGYSRVRQVNQATGRVVPSAFADKLNLHGHWQAMPGLMLGLNINHWFKPKQNPETTLTSDRRTVYYVRRAFTVADFDARWLPRPHASGPFGRDLEVSFGIKNLFDAQFVHASNTEASSFVGKGRNVYLSVSTRF